MLFLLIVLFVSVISDFCCVGKFKLFLFDTVIICSFCFLFVDFVRIILVLLESVNDVRFFVSVFLLLIFVCGFVFIVNDKFLFGKM